MLTMWRKDGDTVTIGDKIKITILSGKGRQVKICVVAPKEIKVLRKELHDKKID